MPKLNDKIFWGIQASYVGLSLAADIAAQTMIEDFDKNAPADQPDLIKTYPFFLTSISRWIYFIQLFGLEQSPTYPLLQNRINTNKLSNLSLSLNEILILLYVGVVLNPDMDLLPMLDSINTHIVLPLLQFYDQYRHKRKFELKNTMKSTTLFTMLYLLWNIAGQFILEAPVYSDSTDWEDKPIGAAGLFVISYLVLQLLNFVTKYFSVKLGEDESELIYFPCCPGRMFPQPKKEQQAELVQPRTDSVEQVAL